MEEGCGFYLCHFFDDTDLTETITRLWRCSLHEAQPLSPCSFPPCVTALLTFMPRFQNTHLKSLLRTKHIVFFCNPVSSGRKPGKRAEEWHRSLWPDPSFHEWGPGPKRYLPKRNTFICNLWSKQHRRKIKTLPFLMLTPKARAPRY